MIVAMQKISVIVQAKDAAAAVRQIRYMGVLHVQHQQPPAGKDIAALTENIVLLDTALNILSAGSAQPPEGPADGLGQTPEQFCRHIVDLSKRIEQLEEYGRSLKASIAVWQGWGDFDPQLVNALAGEGVSVQLFQIPAAEIRTLPPGIIVERMHAEAGAVNCAVISRQPVQLPYKELTLPRQGLAQMQRKFEEDSRMAGLLKKELADSRQHLSWLQEHKDRRARELLFAEAVAGMGQQDEVVFISGFIPEDAVTALEYRAGQQQWALLIEDPSDEDAVPTLLRNPAWVTMVRPVLGLLGITPGYRELDVSMLFLVFFSLFFGILIGDAGYGLAYLILTVWMQKKWRGNPALQPVARLFYVLSSCAIIWGALTGTFFGQTWLQKFGIRPLVSQLNDVKFMQTFCFFLGALHLSLAHGWRALLKLPSLSCLSDIGWIGVLWSAFLLARTLILGAGFPAWGLWLIYSSVGMVILFTNPQRNIFKAVGAGLGTVALSLMNNFTDVVSYVRLFAVGLAGVAIAETTNAMGASLGSGALAVVAGGLIVAVGHALNMVLGPMSVLVHGVRLNVLEFSGHAGVSWSGVAYQPLKE